MHSLLSSLLQNIKMNLLISAIVSLFSGSAYGLSLGPVVHHETSIISRRSAVHQIAAFGIAVPFICTSNVNAVDAQFAEVGQQEKPPNGETPFVKLPNGVQVKDFRDGSGAKVDKGSKVELTMKGRLLNLNGVSLTDTKAPSVYALKILT